jgi:hypothetical protein
MSTYAVEFERIGRTHGLSATFHAADGDELAEQVYRFARRYLGSRWFVVGLDLDEGTGSIEAGRSGRFTFHEVPGIDTDKAGAA